MTTVTAALLGSILVAGLVLAIAWVAAARRASGTRWPRWSELTVGFVVAFFDTLGIGSFAPTTAAYKLFHLVPDERIPGTLIVGTTASVILQSLIFVTSVPVAPPLLAAMVVAAAAGAWFGAGIVMRLPRRAIQSGMGAALLIAATVFALMNLDVLPGGGEALDLIGWRFPVAVLASLVLGALMTVGIGMYAPTMILLAVFGMHPLAAFPVMMGACALLQPVSGVRFVRGGWLAWGPALGLAIGGVPAVLLAAFVVKSLPLRTLRWVVVAVVLYAAFAMLRSATRAPEARPSA